MKKVLLTLTTLIILSSTGFAQHAIAGIGFNGTTNYATVTDDSSLDIGGGLTLEMWFKPTGNVTDDQKLLGKTAIEFPLVNSYVIGIIDGQILFEVYDENSITLNTKGGTVIANSWNHVAGTFDRDTGVMKLYLNGELVDEDSNTNLGDFDYVTTDLILGAAPWFSGSKNYNGHMDEVRLFKEAVDQATIQEWMLRDLDDSHPNWGFLRMYLKCNAGSGQSVEDSSSNNNTADVSTIYTWTTSDAPFEGDYDLLESVPAGIWNGHTTDESSILTLSGSGLTGTSSIVIGYDFSSVDQIFYDGPNGYEITMGRLWKVTTQDAPGTVTVTADLTEVTLENIVDIALVGAPTIGELPSASVFNGGTINGNTFTVSGVTFEDGWIYTLAFKIGAVGTTNLEETAFINVAPNPSNGFFEVNVALEEVGDVNIRVLNIAGQEVAQQSFNNQQEINTSFDLSTVPKGIYLIKIQEGDAVSTKRIVIE